MNFLSLVLLDQCLVLSVNLSSLKLSFPLFFLTIRCSVSFHLRDLSSAILESCIPSYSTKYNCNSNDNLGCLLLLILKEKTFSFNYSMIYRIPKICISSYHCLSQLQYILSDTSKWTSQTLCVWKKAPLCPLKANFSQLCHIYHWSYHFLSSQDLNFESFLIVSSPRIIGPVTNILSILSLQILSSLSHISFYCYYCRQLTHLSLIRRYFRHCFCAMWAVYCSAWAFFSSSVRTSLVGLSCLEPSGILLDHRSNPHPLPRKADS